MENIKGTRRHIWDSPKERQIKWINFAIKKYSIDKAFYRTIRKVFQHENGIRINDLTTKTQKILYRKIFYFKFENSCSNAKYVRCGKKKGYENIEFLLGDWNGLIRNLKKYRPDLVEKGISICEQYIKNNFDNKLAPVVHRKSDSGNYEWDNIEIMPKGEHDELTRQERERKKRGL